MASYDIVAKVRADMTQFISGMKSGELATSSFTQKMGGMGNAVAVGTAAAVAVAGIALFKLGESFEKSYKQIRVSTGQTGAALEGLEQSFRNVYAKTPASMGDVSTAVSDLSVKLGLTGAPLEALSLQVIQLSRITGTDLKGNIEAVTMVFKNFSVSAEDQKGKLDLLYRASQNSGVSVSQLASTMASSGIVLRQLGLDFDSSAALIGTFAKAGIDAGDVMPGLTFALKSAAKEGVNTADKFTKTFDAIKAAPSITEATGIAMDTFGGRAGPKLAAAIQEGKLSYTDFMDTIQTGSDTIAKTSSDVGTFGGKLSVLGHQLQLALEPLASSIFQMMNTAMKAVMPVFEDIFGLLRNVVDAFLALPGPVKAIIPVIAGLVLAMKGLMALKTIMLILQAATAQAMTSMAAAAGQFVMSFLGMLPGMEAAAVTAGVVVESAFLPIVAVALLAFGAFMLFTQASRDSEKAQKEYANTLDKTTGAITEQSVALTQEKLQHQGVLDVMNRAGISMEQVTGFIKEHNAERIRQGDLEHMVRRTIEETRFSLEAGMAARQKYAAQLRDMGGANNEFLATMMENGALTMDTINTLYDEADAYEKKQQVLDAVNISTKMSTGMTYDAAKAANDAANANKAQADSIQKVMDAQHAATDPIFAAIKAQIDAKKATDDYNRAVAEGKAGKDELTAMTVAQAEAAAAYRDAITKLDIAQLKGDSTNEKVISGLAQLRSFGFEPTAAQVQMLTNAIELNQLKLIATKDPAQAFTDILKEMTAAGTEPTSESIGRYIENLKRMEDKLAPDDPMRKNLDDTITKLIEFGNQHPVATAKVEMDDASWQQWMIDHKAAMAAAYNPNSYKYPGRAVGGLVARDTGYLIGERGPELFVPQVPGSIISADRVASMSAANAGAGPTYVTTVNATVNLPAGVDGEDVVDAITRFERRNGKVFARA